MTQHAIWVDANNDADLTRLRAHGIDSPYFDGRDPRVTAAYLQDLAGRGFKPGLYYAWNWWPTLDGPGFAQRVSNDLRRIGWAGNPPVCLDIETHDIAGYVLPCLTRWRALRPTRETIWTLEGMQGGLFTPTQVAEINRLNVLVGPQLYVGDMQPHPHSPVIDLLMAGFDGRRIVGFYDAARLPYRWSGIAFSQGRLPA
jgi:hypothetical protein